MTCEAKLCRALCPQSGLLSAAVSQWEIDWLSRDPKLLCNSMQDCSTQTEPSRAQHGRWATCAAMVLFSNYRPTGSTVFALVCKGDAFPWLRKRHLCGHTGGEAL